MINQTKSSSERIQDSTHPFILKSHIDWDGALLFIARLSAWISFIASIWIPVFWEIIIPWYLAVMWLLIYMVLLSIASTKRIRGLEPAVGDGSESSGLRTERK